MKQILFFVLLLIINLYASGQILTGIVKDQFGNILHNSHILNKSTNEHTHTNIEGKFKLDKASIGNVLKISHIGFEDKEITVKSISQEMEIMLFSNFVNLEEVIITPEINTLKLITDIDIRTNPVNSSQDILKRVPGLFVGQHAGGGKAEQIFLRGFDIDHGTDITISVDGLPVNIVSHAHGQGYADLHFVIPETIQEIDFGKGPFYANKGNFNTAGYVDFKTKENLKSSNIKLEAGQFDTYRILGTFNLLDKTNHNSYIAAEYLATEGYFESPQNFNRINLFGKYTGVISDKDKIVVTLSHFNSEWDASGQIPQRAVDNGLISRFGAIDDTEGGNTSRTNILFNYDKIIDDSSNIQSSVFWNQYELELYSNFTFFLEDPINGDQIKQKEKRNIFGINSVYNQKIEIGNIEGSLFTGISLRNDKSFNNELSHTKNRIQTLERIQYGDINESNFALYLGTKIHWKQWSFSPSIRLDYFDFKYNNHLEEIYKTQSENEAIISPKLDVFYNFSNKLQFYAKLGQGFHSNDTRVVINQQGNNILPSAFGTDIGMVWKPTSKMFVNLAYWYLYLEQEFVYVGDAGIVEPSGKTKRQGIEFSYRYQVFPWLLWNLDTNYTYARAIEEQNNQDYIPLAPDLTLSSGVTINHKSGIYGGLHVRHLKDRPANEDNSIIAKGYTVTDLNIGYRWNNFDFGIQIQNLFDTEWNETQFATESRLENEINSAEEIHFTPGTPFFFKTIVSYNF